MDTMRLLNFAIVVMIISVSVSNAKNSSPVKPRSLATETNEVTDDDVPAKSKQKTDSKSQKLPMTNKTIQSDSLNDPQSVPSQNLLTSSPSPDSVRQFVVKEAKQTCIIATFELTVLVSYEASVGNKTRAASTKVELPDDVVISGQCPNNQSGQAVLQLTWRNGAFKISLTFDSTKNSTNVKRPGAWFVSEVTLTITPNDPTLFPDAVNDQPLTISRLNMSLFMTPLGLSYACVTGAEVNLGVLEQGAALVFSNIQIQAFDIKNDEFGAPNICYTDQAAKKIQAQNIIVPVIVASCLAVVIIVIVVGYVINRNIRKTGYRHMM